MKLVLLVGDSAVGKMTVGQELAKLTGLRLCHNHMTIEPVVEVFGRFDGRITQRLREVIFEEFAKSELYGMIYTFMWAFNYRSYLDYIEHMCDIFRRYNAEIYVAELYAPLEIRLQRNVSENRLKHKPSRRDTEASNRWLVDSHSKYRCISNENEIPFENHIKIDNSALPPETVAQMIKERFDL